jgi:2-iminoacetate synthase ThiH
MSFLKTIDELLKKKSPIRKRILFPEIITLYFIGLEDNKMFLYTSYEKPDDEIMEDCSKLYEYARIYKPRNIVFRIPEVDLFDIDKFVKMFMQMFGVDDTRGGSYVDVILPDFQQKALDIELFTATDDFVKANGVLLLDVC